MKKVITILILSCSLSSCTIVGNFYLLNKSKTDLAVTINVRSMNKEVAQNYVVRIDDDNGKRIKYSTYKKLKKREIAVDSLNRQFQFTLYPNEVAHIGYGPNTRIWNVENVIINKSEEVIQLDGASYGQFAIQGRGLFKYVGIKEIRD